MKKFIFLLLNIMLVLILLIGCTKDTNSTDVGESDSLNQDAQNNTNDDDSAVNGTGKDNSNEKNIDEPVLSFKDEFKKQGLKSSPYSDEWELTRLGWINKYLELAYKDDAIRDLNASIVSEDSRDIISNLELRIEKIFIQFNSDKELQSLKTNDSGEYTSQIYMIYSSNIEEGIKYYYLLDVVNGEENSDNKLDIFEYALDVLNNDERFTKNMDVVSIFNKDNNLSDNVILFENDEILNGYKVYDIYKENDKLILLLTQPVKVNSNGVSLLNNIKLCGYDYYTKEMSEIVKAENIDGNYFNYYSDRGIEYGTYNENYLLGFDGKISKIDDKKTKYIYSPDKKYYAYSDEERNLIVKNAETQDVLIKLESVRGEDKKASEHKSYGAYAWLDNENLLYSIGGWEWSNGIGIINANTLEDTFLDESRLKHISKIDNKRLTVSYTPHGDAHPFSIGYYDLDKKPYVYHEDFNSANYPQIYDSAYNLSFLKLFSKDMAYAYTFEDDYEKSQYVIKIFSIAEEKLIDEIKVVPNKNIPFDYIRSGVLLEDKILAICNGSDLYFVELIQ